MLSSYYTKIEAKFQNSMLDIHKLNRYNSGYELHATCF
jgi:hypothetical protein